MLAEMTLNNLQGPHFAHAPLNAAQVTPEPLVSVSSES